MPNAAPSAARSALPGIFEKKVPALMSTFMSDFKCSEYDSAACFGNAGHESNGFRTLQEIKPTVEGSRGGWGWFQWTGPRRREFEAYCARNNLDPASDAANYGFLFVELTGSEKGAIPALKAAGTLRDKVIAFELAYERAGAKHYASRETWAKRALTAYREREIARAKAVAGAGVVVTTAATGVESAKNETVAIPPPMTDAAKTVSPVITYASIALGIAIALAAVIAIARKKTEIVNLWK